MWNISVVKLAYIAPDTQLKFISITDFIEHDQYYSRQLVQRKTTLEESRNNSVKWN